MIRADWYNMKKMDGYSMTWTDGHNMIRTDGYNVTKIQYDQNKIWQKYNMTKTDGWYWQIDMRWTDGYRWIQMDTIWDGQSEATSADVPKCSKKLDVVSRSSNLSKTGRKQAGNTSTVVGKCPKPSEQVRIIPKNTETTEIDRKCGCSSCGGRIMMQWLQCYYNDSQDWISIQQSYRLLYKNISVPVSRCE